MSNIHKQGEANVSASPSLIGSEGIAEVVLKKLLIAVLLCVGCPAIAYETALETYQNLQNKIHEEFLRRTPQQWGEKVSGVKTRLNTKDRVVALTLDACGSSTGKGFDAALFEFLQKEQIPATLFINARWIDANPDLFKKLAANPLFEIANHGWLHRPASVSGRSAYNIEGTRDVKQLVDEIEKNARKIFEITGSRPRYYRSGTAYYDEVAVEVSQRLGHKVVGFSILGDAGATFSKDQVKGALLKAVPGDIAILHMNHPQAGTAAGVAAAVPELRRRGFSFVKLSDYELQ